MLVYIANEGGYFEKDIAIMMMIMTMMTNKLFFCLYSL